MYNFLSQEEVKALYESNRHEVSQYKKVGEIHAKLAEEGVVVTTILKGIVETTNTPKQGDVVIKNLQTEDQEEYVVTSEKFHTKYEGPELTYQYQSYNPVGYTYGFKYSGEDFKFVASWGEEMICHDGDHLCQPEPDLEHFDIYRIEKDAFRKTYVK